MYATEVQGVDVTTFSFLGPFHDEEFQAVRDWLREVGIRYVDASSPCNQVIIIRPIDGDDLIALSLRLPCPLPTSRAVLKQS